jgi:drug/metabolite transporter (DMT)-like permease
MVGFGLGDIALFHAYERIGSRRTILLAQCGAVPFAALTEWIWLKTVIPMSQLLWIFLILGGIFLAVRPKKESQLPPGVLGTGVGFGLLAALGQAWGAVLSRKAVALNDIAGIHLDGWTSSFQRILAGIVVAACFFAWFRWRRRPFRQSGLARLSRKDRLRAGFLCLGNGIAGPVLGVGCYQWALSQTASGIVLAVVATTPVVTLPLVWFLGEDKPDTFSILGSILAVAGVVGLLLT